MLNSYFKLCYQMKYYELVNLIFYCFALRGRRTLPHTLYILHVRHTKNCFGAGKNREGYKHN